MSENHCNKKTPCNYRKRHNDSAKNNRINNWIKKHPLMLWILPLTGLLSLIWFFVRVIPKPSRATYPCQRAAASLAGGFLAWIGAMIASSLLYKRARNLLSRSKYVLSGLFAALGVLLIYILISSTYSNPTMASFRPSDLANEPIGIAKGINPGRVVWAYDPNATSWDGRKGHWWDDSNTNQSAVDKMVSGSIRNLCSQQTDEEAWDALFKHFNKLRIYEQGPVSGDTPEAGYKAGEKIAIKVNCNQDRSAQWDDGRRPEKGLPSPQVIYALISQLINNAGVPGKDITIYEVTHDRNIGDPIYKKIRANPDSNFQQVKFVVNDDYGLGGRIEPVHDKKSPIHFSQRNLPTAYLPTCVTEAKYLINFAIFRPHGMFGITLCAKNHFGSIYFPKDGGWTPYPLHGAGTASNPMGSANCLVDLIGHKHLGGKTILYMIDGLYPSSNNEGGVIRFLSFGDDWTSSIFMSQDPVAIDSVGLDFLRNEPKATDVRGNCDNYLHEAALANKPPSGAVYDPEHDGTRLTSLGVHEHWNNSKDKKYSRNLGTGNGIELTTVGPMP